MTEEAFVKSYSSFFDDSRKARAAYRQAQAVQEKTALLWANIKDSVASPFMKDTLFNNVPKSFIEHQQSIPGYDKLFGSLDFLECEHCRSIFGPAAYFVDLMRFIEKHVPQNHKSSEFPDGLEVGHLLEDRQPRLFRMALDCENTFNLVPYIDLVIEVLEDVVRSSQEPNPYAQLEQATFPAGNALPSSACGNPYLP